MHHLRYYQFLLVSVLLNPFLGAALGMILVHPNLMSAYDFPKAIEVGKANTTLGCVWVTY